MRESLTSSFGVSVNPNFLDGSLAAEEASEVALGGGVVHVADEDALTLASASSSLTVELSRSGPLVPASSEASTVSTSEAASVASSEVCGSTKFTLGH